MIASSLGLLLARFIILATPSETPINEYHLTIDPATEYQTIDAFGASDAWSMQKIGAWSDANKNLVADLLFSATKGIALSHWRFNVGAGIDHEGITNPWRTVETFEVLEGKYDWSRQANERWFLAAAKSRGVSQFTAFSDSPTARMTKNGLTHCSPEVGSTNLKDGFEPQYARYLADILKHFRDNPLKDERIDFQWISPINEPEWDWNGSSQEGNRASNQDIRKVVSALSEELDRQGLATKILMPESGSMEHLHDVYQASTKRYGTLFGNYLDELAAQISSNSRLDNTICAHSYWNDKLHDRLLQSRQRLREATSRRPGLRYWQTEYCVMQGPNLEGGHGRDLGMTTALNVARVIHCDLTEANASAWFWWLAISQAAYKDGLIYTDYNQPGDAESVFPSKTLWALGHYSRFIRPGAVRLGVSGPRDLEGLLASAYRDADGRNLYVVLTNMKHEQIQVRTDFVNLPKSVELEEIIPYLTTEVKEIDLKELRHFAPEEGFVMPARSMATLVAPCH